jgi:hypothetical protein
MREWISREKTEAGKRELEGIAPGLPAAPETETSTRTKEKASRETGAELTQVTEPMAANSASRRT